MGINIEQYDVRSQKFLVTQVGRLRQLGARQRFIGLQVVMVTVMNIANILISSACHRFDIFYPFGYLESLWLSGGLAFLAIMLLVFFDNARRHGDALFEELSDELQWHVRETQRPDARQGPERPPLEFRLALRRFVQSSELPLIPGRLGPAVYAAINVGIMVFAILIKLPVNLSAYTF